MPHTLKSQDSMHIGHTQGVLPQRKVLLFLEICGGGWQWHHSNTKTHWHTH